MSTNDVLNRLTVLSETGAFLRQVIYKDWLFFFFFVLLIEIPLERELSHYNLSVRVVPAGIHEIVSFQFQKKRGAPLSSLLERFRIVYCVIHLPHSG